MTSLKSSIQKTLTEHRGWVVLFTALPLSFLFDKYFTFRNWIYRSFIASDKFHDKHVAEVQEQVRKWSASGKEKLMCTARKPWLNMSPRTATFKKDCNQIDIDLRDILGIDTQRQVIHVEPGVDMGYITRYLLPKGWALVIQVEMEDLTVGGLCMGLGMETNSHRYGLIQETIEAVEIITSDGSLVRATRTENADLFMPYPGPGERSDSWWLWN